MSPTSPKATTHPGGAPLKKLKRECKYGPRDSEGRCPKKPSSSRSRPASNGSKAPSKSSSRPCKYGPRVNGRCPPRPKTAKKDRAPSVRDYESVNRAAKQAGQVLRSKKATGEQKKEAVKVLGTAVAGEVAKKVAEHTYREAKKAVRHVPAETKAKVARQVAKAAGTIGKGTLVGAAIAGTLAVGGAKLDAQRRKEANRYANAELKKTMQRLGGKLTPDQQNTLWKQYYDYYLSQPVQNPYLGK